MPRLVVHPRFGRPIRMDPIEELGVPTQDWVEDFLRAEHYERIGLPAPPPPAPERPSP